MGDLVRRVLPALFAITAACAPGALEPDTSVPPGCACATHACDGTDPVCDEECACGECTVSSEDEWRERYPTTLERLQYYQTCGRPAP